MTKNFLARSVLASLSCTLILAASNASACRDCPFPMKIGQHQWLLPQSDIVLTIEEQAIADNEVIMTITLQDSANGRMIAEGQVSRQRSQHTVTIQLLDRNGRKMHGTLTWTDEGHDNLQAEFISMDLYSRAAPTLSLIKQK